MFVNHLCEAKGEQNGEANKAQESFAEFVISSSDSPATLDSLKEVFHPMTTPVELSENGTAVVRLERPGMQVLSPLAAALCLRMELS